MAPCYGYDTIIQYKLTSSSEQVQRTDLAVQYLIHLNTSTRTQCNRHSKGSSEAEGHRWLEEETLQAVGIRPVRQKIIMFRSPTWFWKEMLRALRRENSSAFWEADGGHRGGWETASALP